MIRVKLTLLTQQTLLHINPSHQDEPFQSSFECVICFNLQIRRVFIRIFRPGLILEKKREFWHAVIKWFDFQVFHAYSLWIHLPNDTKSEKFTKIDAILSCN